MESNLYNLLWCQLRVLYTNQAAVEELEHPREEDVSEVSINNLQLPKNRCTYTEV